MLELIIRAIVEATRESRRAEESRRAWQQQRAWEEQQRLWQAQQLQWNGGLQPSAPGDRAYAPPPVPRPAVTQKPPEPAAARPTTPAPAPRRAPRLASATAPAVAQWMRPETLRSQFILTEVLKPPLALRPPRV